MDRTTWPMPQFTIATATTKIAKSTGMSRRIAQAAPAKSGHTKIAPLSMGTAGGSALPESPVHVVEGAGIDRVREHRIRIAVLDDRTRGAV